MKLYALLANNCPYMSVKGHFKVLWNNNIICKMINIEKNRERSLWKLENSGLNNSQNLILTILVVNLVVLGIIQLF